MEHQTNSVRPCSRKNMWYSSDFFSIVKESVNHSRFHVPIQCTWFLLTEWLICESVSPNIKMISRISISDFSVLVFVLIQFPAKFMLFCAACCAVSVNRVLHERHMWTYFADELHTIPICSIVHFYTCCVSWPVVFHGDNTALSFLQNRPYWRQPVTVLIRAHCRM